MKVLVKRRPSAPTVAAGLFIRGGARNINEKNAGIENLTLAAAVEAGTTFPRAALRRELSRTGSTISAAAAKDYSAISFASTRQNFDRVWNLFTDVSVNPAFLQEDVERVRGQILAGLREAQTSPDSALQSLQERVIYAGHPYANDVTGTVGTIGAFTAADLRAYHKNLMQTSRLLLVVVGDIDPNELRTRVASSFGKLPRGEYKEQPLPVLDFSKGTLDITPRTIQTNYVQGIFDAPSLSNPDYFAMRVAATILQQMVYEEVRVKRQLSYAPSADLNNFGANTANIYVTAVDANQAVKVMLDQIEQLKNNEINQEAIDGMAGQFLTNYYLGQETNAAQAGELARYELIGGGWRNTFEFLNRIREVRSADVQAVVRKYMKNIRFVVIGNPQAVDKNVFIAAVRP
jgi:predicted Zn-dependent peptidase